MMTEARRKQWLTLRFSRDHLHVSSVCIAVLGSVVGETVLVLAQMSFLFGFCFAFMALCIGLVWGTILDVKGVTDSRALTAMRQLAVAKVVILLVVIPFFNGWLVGFLVDLLVVSLAGVHTTIAMGRGVRESFARQQAEIDAAEGIRDGDRRDFDGDEE